MTNNSYKFVPYLSAEVAFLSFATDFKDYAAANPDKVYLRSGPKDSTSTLRPREILGLAIMANIAMYLTDETWVPGYFVAEDGTALPENVAHDGGIRCTSGNTTGSFMHFEQAMATEVAANATPDDIEGAIIHEVNRKSSRDDSYVGNTALLIFTDYTGELGNLKKLASDVSTSKYQTIYLICTTAPLKDFVCVTLKSPGNEPRTISVKFDRPDGVANVARLQA